LTLCSERSLTVVTTKETISDYLVVVCIPRLVGLSTTKQQSLIYRYLFWKRHGKKSGSASRMVNQHRVKNVDEQRTPWDRNDGLLRTFSLRHSAKKVQSDLLKTEENTSPPSLTLQHGAVTLYHGSKGKIIDHPW